MAKDFDAYFVKLVTRSLLTSSDEEARRTAGHGFAARLRTGLAERRSADRRRILSLLERQPGEVRGYLAARSRSLRARNLLAILAAFSLAAALSLAAATIANGVSGSWVAVSDSAMVTFAIGACFAYVVLVSATNAANRRLRRLEEETRGGERRAGRDRRRGLPGTPPGGIERRSGIDRRTIAARGWSDVP